MKKTSFLKLLSVVFLTIMLVFNIVTVVRADDEDDAWGDWDTPTVTSNTTTTPTPTTEENSAININDTNSTTYGNVYDSTNSATNNTANTSYNAIIALNTTNSYGNEVDNNTNVNSLAYTGTENNSILAVVFVAGIVIAIYSLKKINYYKSL